MGMSEGGESTRGETAELSIEIRRRRAPEVWRPPLLLHHRLFLVAEEVSVKVLDPQPQTGSLRLRVKAGYFGTRI